MKEFLSQKGVPYTEKDISQDEAAMNELIEIGVLSTPVTKINGDIVIGFDRKKFGELLGI